MDTLQNGRYVLTTVELGYNVTKGPECLVSLQNSVALTECNVLVNSEESIGPTEYLTV